MQPWERELVEILANDLRALSLAQIVRGWFADRPSARRQALRGLRQLADQGWLQLRQVLARPIAPLSGPLLTWRHAEPTPEFAPLAQQLHQRAQCAAQLTTLAVATPIAQRLLGGSQHRTNLKLTQTTHDVQVSEIFFRLQATAGGIRPRWCGEDRLPTPWPIRERPDALLLDEQGEPERALEYGGDYPVDRLLALHHGLSSLPLAYEIW